MCLIVDQVCMICILVYMIEMINKMNCIFWQILQEIGFELDLVMFVEKMEMLEDKICKIMKIVKELILMEMLIGDDDDFYFGDFIEDINMVVLVDVVLYVSMCDVVKDVFDLLMLCEVKVLWMCFGIEMSIDYMFEEVGKQFDVMCEWICQIEVKVLCKLCYLSCFDKLKLFFEGN